MAKYSAVRTLVLFNLLLVASPIAYAQATRTWVSGVGDDANPCSRTAPCKTFAGAISKTAARGEINVLDPGGFGGVTITKSISIVAEGVTAGVLVSGTNGIVINAGASDVVVLRGLDIEGLGTGLNGIRFLAGGTLFVEDCTINNFSGSPGLGIAFEPSGASRLVVTDTVVRNNFTAGTGGGILIRPSGGGSAIVALDNVQSHRNIFGVKAQGSATVTVTRSVFSHNNFAGIWAEGGTITVDSSQISNSVANGVLSNGAAAVVRIGSSVISGNGTGFAASGGGALLSFGFNKLAGNGVDGVSTGGVPLS
jgi:hypothetical protein